MKVTPVLLAKDILKWLEPKSPVKIRLKTGYGYLRTSFGQDRRLPLIITHFKADLRKYIKAGKPCEVCALGALVVAKAYRMDQVQLTACSMISYEIREALRDIFTFSDMIYIEHAFEHGIGLQTRSRSAVRRMKEICHNIIRNKGQFIPDDDEG